jgi:hypothetical protein
VKSTLTIDDQALIDGVSDTGKIGTCDAGDAQ